MYKMMRSLCIR